MIVDLAGDRIMLEAFEGKGGAMSAGAPTMVLSGTLRLSDQNAKRTVGQFSVLVRDNVEVFKRYFGIELFAGSLNVDISEPSSLQADLDAGHLLPAGDQKADLLKWSRSAKLGNRHDATSKLKLVERSI